MTALPTAQKMAYDASYAIGLQVLSPGMEAALDRVVLGGQSSNYLIQALDGLVAGAGDALAAAQDSWRREGRLPTRGTDPLLTNLASVLTLACHCGAHSNIAHAQGLAVVDLLLGVTEPRAEHAAALAVDLQGLRKKGLAAFDQVLLTQPFLARVADRIGFGVRQVRHTSDVQIQSECIQWSHPEQVDVALRRSTLSRKMPLEAMLFARTPAAFARVLDTWPSERPSLWADGMGPIELMRWSLAAFAHRAFDTRLQRAVATAGPASPTAASRTALDLLRALRDHPRTAATFWADVRDARGAGAQEVPMLEAFLALAVESPGPEAEAALEQLAAARVEHWDVPPQTAARAALQLRMRRAPVDDMVMP